MELIGFASAPDPFGMINYPLQGLSGIPIIAAGLLIPVSSIISSPSTTKTVLIGGQSNMATAPGTTLYTAVSNQAQFLNPGDGGIYVANDPILGCSSAPSVGISNITGRLMDRIISQGKATRSIGVNCAIGGTPFAAWPQNTAGSLFSNVATSILRCRSRSLEPDAIIWGEGEQDNIQSSSSATVTAGINSLVDGIRAMNCIAPFYIGKYTMVGGAINSTVQTGIANSITGATGRNIFAGYDADTNCTVAGGFRLADGTHLSNTGLTLAANGWQGIIFP